MINFLSELLVSLLIVSGGVFALVGSIGLAKLPDLTMRLHGPTKATTLGVGSLLIASMTYFLLFEGTFSIHELLITIFLFLTAPISANLVAKTALHRGLSQRAEVPLESATPGISWATFQEAPDDGSDARQTDRSSDAT